MASDAYSAKALLKQRTGGKSLVDLDKLMQIIQVHQGWTATQAAWKAAGGEVDENGYCLPAEQFQFCLQFFNYKRRVSENAFEREQLSEHPRAKFVYGSAKCNPYNVGGAGVYPLHTKAVTAESVTVDTHQQQRESDKADTAAKQQTIAGILSLFDE